jgi:chaperonin GroES
MRILGDRILIKSLENPEKASESIYYAPQHAPEQQVHIVLGVGTGRKLRNGERLPIPLKVGDKVLLDQYALNDRTQTPDGNWIVPFSACSLAVTLDAVQE